MWDDKNEKRFGYLFECIPTAEKVKIAKVEHVADSSNLIL